MFDAKKVKDQCVAWIRKFFQENGPDCKAVLGISGGKDSSIVAALCVEALGKDRVIGVLMPQGDQHDIDASYQLVNHLGIKHYVVNIKDAVDGIVNNMVNDVSVQYSAWAYKQKKNCLVKRNYAQVITFKDYADFNLKLKDVKIDVTNYDNSYKYNTMLLFRPTTENNLAVVMSEKYKNEVDVNWFTGLFNVSYAEFKDRITYIDEFPDKDIVCGIYDIRGFQFRKVLDKTTALPNGADLTENRWTHFWRVHSVSPLYSAIVFKKESDENKSDVAELVKGYDVENKAYIDDTTITAPFDGFYQIDNEDPEEMVKDDEITVDNPKDLRPVTITFYKDIAEYDENNENDDTEPELVEVYKHRIRFEYPSNIDATLGHPMEIQ